MAFVTIAEEEAETQMQWRLFLVLKLSVKKSP